MGTNAHAPHPRKPQWQGAHDDQGKAPRAGERPGVPSRIEAARERLRRKGDR